MRSRKLLFDADALGQRATELKTGEVGVLRVGATPQAIENLLADFLSRYRKHHLGVEVHLVEDGGSRLPGRLERGDIDVAVMPAGEDRFRGRLLFPFHVLAVMPQRHRLSSRAVLDVTELADEPLLRLNSSFASHAWFAAACQVAHIRPRVLLESGVPQPLIALACAGHGVAVVPSAVQVHRVGVRVAVCRASQGIDRAMGRRRLGRAARPAAICGAIRRGTGSPMPAQLPRPRVRPPCAAAAAAKRAGQLMAPKCRLGVMSDKTQAEHNESASLIGRLGSSAFRLSTTAVSMSLTGSRFSSGRSIMGFEDEAEQSIGRPYSGPAAPPRAAVGNSL